MAENWPRSGAWCLVCSELEQLVCVAIRCDYRLDFNQLFAAALDRNPGETQNQTNFSFLCGG
jgi:hypothetical protein